jgi:RES domain
MFGEIEPLKALQDVSSRSEVVSRIIAEYPTVTLTNSDKFYRVRKDPSVADDPAQYDSPPASLRGSGRLESDDISVLYASYDLASCIQECRFNAEDDLYVATLSPTSNLKLLDLTAVLEEANGITEFESLDLTVHMLFLAGSYSYEISRAIAKSASDAGFDGLMYPSFFSMLRTGHLSPETTYGMSHRQIPQLRERERAKIVPNIALFGQPISGGILKITSINRLVIRRVEYSFHFGPVGVDSAA